MAYDSDGKDSEWNEASFKSKRLSDIQERINYFKTNLLGLTDGNFNYSCYEKEIESLLGEGRSKYSEKEKKEVDKLRGIANKTLKLMPPHIPSSHKSLDGTKPSYIFNKKNYDNLLELLYKFEMRIKDLNDEHGLTTKNRTTEDLF